MAMDKSAADAYVYAKASGMLARSFIGGRAAQLFEVHSLKELWTLLFKKEVPVMPEKLLAKALESEDQKDFISQYYTLLGNYAHPDEILIALLHLYDYSNIKQIGASLCFDEKEMPSIVDITPWNIIDYSKWPDLKAMTEKSSLSWYDKKPEIHEQQQNDYKLDCQYINEVWTAAKKVSASCRSPIFDLLGGEFKIENIIWALRLRVYYNMDKEEIMDHLSFVQDVHDDTDPVAGDAVRILDYDVDSFDSWKTWKYGEFLNPHEEGVVWKIDPRWVYNASRKQYVEKAMRMFHLYPFTACPLVCWYIIKQNELDTIRTASESLRMNVKPSQAMQLAGVTEE